MTLLTAIVRCAMTQQTPAAPVGEPPKRATPGTRSGTSSRVCSCTACSAGSPTAGWAPRSWWSIGIVVGAGLGIFMTLLGSTALRDSKAEDDEPKDSGEAR